MKMRWVGLLLLVLLAAGCSKKETTGPQKHTGTGSFALGSLLQSNMVVQRDKPFVIWGTAAANEKVTVNVSWNLNTLNTFADANGNWKLTIAASPANANPQTITAKPDGGTGVVLTNILLGDVWVCSGQSNMVMPVDVIAPFTGVIDYQAEIAAANYPLIRTLAVQEDYENSPATELKKAVKWNICSPQNAGSLSAVAYFFARKLHITLNVPVGIIVSAINGSYCQEWANTDAIASDPVLTSNYSGNSSTLYNGMISPLTNLAIRGFVWYQGENNQHDDPASYTKLNSALIKGWRTQFKDAALPFYLVQLTPFAEDYNTTNPPGGDKTLDYLAKFREGQANVLSTPGTGMAVTMDVGEEANHHPRNKKPVGERLALLALKNTFNQNVECYGPHFSSWSASGNTATISFSAGTANGLITINNQPLKQFFFVAGTDHVFRQGGANIAGNGITVVAPAGTPLPIQAVRYAFTNAPVTNLQNSAGLPAEPFRTDNWGN
ncbi:MAG: sialate O-acetylesterase [Bacteroidota bacterium]|nr:sialate O-acetylesterase [Bacteroidota bacterium]